MDIVSMYIKLKSKILNLKYRSLGNTLSYGNYVNYLDEWVVAYIDFKRNFDLPSYAELGLGDHPICYRIIPLNISLLTKGDVIVNSYNEKLRWDGEYYKLETSSMDNYLAHPIDLWMIN